MSNSSTRMRPFFALAVILGLSCGGLADTGTNGCPVPAGDQFVRTSEDCVREVHFPGCELKLLRQPYAFDDAPLYDAPPFDIDADGVVSIKYKPVADAADPIEFVLELRHAKGPSDPWEYDHIPESSSIKTSDTGLIAGTNVLLYGTANGRGATWHTECVVYNLAVVYPGAIQGLQDAVLTRAIAGSLK